MNLILKIKNRIQMEQKLIAICPLKNLNRWVIWMVNILRMEVRLWIKLIQVMVTIRHQTEKAM